MTNEGPVLVDNTVLSNLALVGQYDVIQCVWGSRACTTREVLDEYEAGARAGLVQAGVWDDMAVLTLTPEELRFESNLPPRLGAGERTCLAAACLRRGLLATDDRVARGLARRHGVPTTGTVGVLVLGVRRGVMSRQEANALLRQMIALGYRSPVTDLDPLLH